MSKQGLDDVISEEIEIAFMAGIPYATVFDSNGENVRLKPIQSINMEEASIGAPQDLLDILNSVQING